MMSRLNKIISLIKASIDGIFTGKITIHFNKGVICKIEKNECLRIDS
jgi:hypothetical protein